MGVCAFAKQLRSANIFFCNFDTMTCVLCWQGVAQQSQHRRQEAVAKEDGKLIWELCARNSTLFFREAVESLDVKIGLQMAMYLFVTG